MVLFDVNVLLHAFRRDAEDHVRYKSWLEQTLASDEVCGVSDLVLSAVIRITTHPRIPRLAATMAEALRFVEELREHPGTVLVAPGPRHWQIFTGLCQDAGVKGALVTDAYFAALAIENSAEWITTDRDYARFPGLRWRHPLA
ncbi:MAG: type II toxin-antitoxin system VapC family toxin [Acidobacteria bacterium]|nr:type II toxin-antitoxin system VapC family toxin [Acidobacteriota bacterium]MCL5286494.1 type II toxin-antitoxin system VapC family toxin [Acidobacteriota bacterium]MCL5287785.1 type II toxin-antitoxin system VapC family toxin [Acidobacteriota bacterium]